MKIIIIGATGMLGTDLSKQLHAQGHELILYSSKTIDITDHSSINNILRPVISDCDYLINCAAFTAVDDCESKQEIALAVNSKGPRYLATLCHEFSVPIIHFSTDYVFDGSRTDPYNESDTCAPLNYYGHSKHQGELAIQEICDAYYIFRIQWLYGHNGTHFISTIRRLCQSNNAISIVNDQWGSPTATHDIANYISHIISKKPPFGCYHLTANGETTWYDFAQFIVTSLGLSTTVSPQSSSDYPRPATRPLNGRLCCDKLDSLSLFTRHHWKDSVLAFLTNA